jgi:plasmid maintenance system killer protein
LPHVCTRESSTKYSIRVNDQFRIVFNFERGEATNVTITDYHR